MSTTKYFYILKQRRNSKYQKYKQKQDSWQAVSLYSDDNSFLGSAIFDTKQAANEYAEKYGKRLQAYYNSKNIINNAAAAIKLKIFKVTERPKLELPFYY